MLLEQRPTGSGTLYWRLTALRDIRHTTLSGEGSRLRYADFTTDGGSINENEGGFLHHRQHVVILRPAPGDLRSSLTFSVLHHEPLSQALLQLNLFREPASPNRCIVQLGPLLSLFEFDCRRI